MERHDFRKIADAAELDAQIAQASAAGKTVLFDFYADWCVECKRMERYTFPEKTDLSNYSVMPDILWNPCR